MRNLERFLASAPLILALIAPEAVGAAPAIGGTADTSMICGAPSTETK